MVCCRRARRGLLVLVGGIVRWAPDEVDLWCQTWARERRKLLGLAELEPADRVGKLSGTLGAVRDEREGASQGERLRTFPEVYTGFALLVNRAWHEMREPLWRDLIETHYVYHGKVSTKAIALHLAVSNYWKQLGYAKNYVHSFVIVVGRYEQAENSRVSTPKLVKQAARI